MTDPNVIASINLNRDECEELSMVQNAQMPSVQMCHHQSSHSNSDLSADTDSEAANQKVKDDPAAPSCSDMRNANSCCGHKQIEPKYMRILRITKMVSISLFFIIVVGMMVVHLIASSAPLFESRHKVIRSSPMRFTHVHGCDEVKPQLVQIVDHIKNPKKYEKLGATMPRGYLFVGPHGVGKTMLAKAVAGEANVPFLFISGAEFDKDNDKIGVSRIRAVFKDARAFKKAVIFIDEIDAIAGKQTCNQLFVEMDSLTTDEGTNIIILGATNKVQSLDPTFRQPRRFHKTFNVNRPDISGRKKLLTSLLEAIPEQSIAKDVNIDILASITIKYTGADLSNLINQAKLVAVIEADKSSNTFLITMKHFEKAKDMIEMGPESVKVITQEDKKCTAYHEAGHVVVALATPNSNPVQRATIAPYGDNLGRVENCPEKDLVSESKAMIRASIDVFLGGFIAEEIIFGADNVTTGPSSDIYHANELACRMVENGFGEHSGIFQTDNDADLNLDVRDILTEAMDRVRKLLNTEKAAWHAIAEALIEKETLNKQEIEKLFNDNKVKVDNNALMNKDLSTETKAQVGKNALKRKASTKK